MRAETDERQEMGDRIDRACGMATSLRRAGRLDDADALVRGELARHPGDERLSRALSWVICDRIKALADSPADRFDPSELSEDLRELASLALPEDGNDILYRNLLRRLASLAWGLRRVGDVDALRKCLGVLTSATRVTPSSEWRAKGSPRSDGRSIELSAREAGGLLRPFLSALGGFPDDLSSLIEWSGPTPFVDAEDLRHGAWDPVGERAGAGGAVSGLPKSSFFVEWTSARHGAVGITAYRRSAVREYGAPTVSIERSVVRDPRLARSLRPHEVYDAALSPDGRSILGTPVPCEDPSIRSVFVRGFEGRIELVGDLGFVRIPGGTAATNDVLVPARLLRGRDVPNLSTVSGTAIAAFDEGDEGEDGSWGYVAEKVDRVTPPMPGETRRVISGKLDRSRSGACFVEGCLVPARVTMDAGLAAGEEAEVSARLRWDRRRRTWDWVAVSARRPAPRDTGGER